MAVVKLKKAEALFYLNDEIAKEMDHLAFAANKEDRAFIKVRLGGLRDAKKAVAEAFATKPAA